jgi:aspartate/methionine/tyrosine aminotransferase
LHLITDTFVEDGDSVLVVEPTFDMYRFFAELAGARVVALRLRRRNAFPVDAVVLRIAPAAKRCPRVLFIPNPNNPTGTLVQREDLRRILRRALRARWCLSMKLISIFPGSRFFRGFAAIEICWWRARFQKLRAWRHLRLAACSESLNS